MHEKLNQHELWGYIQVSLFHTDREESSLPLILTVRKSTRNNDNKIIRK